LTLKKRIDLYVDDIVQFRESPRHDYTLARVAFVRGYRIVLFLKSGAMMEISKWTCTKEFVKKLPKIQG
jgi:hypothetical protein